MSYWIDISHPGLNKFRRITHSDKWVCEEKARKQKAAWDEQWALKAQAMGKKKEREKAANQREAQKETAADRTEEASDALDEIETILEHALETRVIFNWESQFDRKNFKEPKPVLGAVQGVGEQPRRPLSQSEPEFTFLDRLISSRKKAKIEAFKRGREACELEYQAAVEKWEAAVAEVEEKKRLMEEKLKSDLNKWEELRAQYLAKQEEFNATVKARQAAYEDGNPDAVTELADHALSALALPDSFPDEFELEYNPLSRILLIEFNLPAPETLPTLKEVRYIQAKDEFKETHISEAQARKAYDSTIYKIVFAAIHYVFKADYREIISAVNFNGWVKSIDRASGNETVACLVSLQVTRGDFFKINLSQVDVKACFKSLKGVSCSTLHTLTPVAPIHGAGVAQEPFCLLEGNSVLRATFRATWGQPAGATGTRSGSFPTARSTSSPAA